MGRCPNISQAIQELPLAESKLVELKATLENTSVKVADINLVFGQWAAIAIAEAKTLFELSRIIISEVALGIQGVQDTTTLVQGEL